MKINVVWCCLVSLVLQESLSAVMVPAVQPGTPVAVATPVSGMQPIQPVQAVAAQPQSTDFRTNLNVFQQLFATFNETTPVATIQQWVTQFLTNIVQVAQTNMALSVNDVADAKTLTDTLIASLASINARLSAKPEEAAKRAMLSDFSRRLQEQDALLAAKAEKNKKIMLQLAQFRSMPNTPFSPKLNQYATILPQLDATIVDPVKTAYIQDLYTMRMVAQAGKGAELNDMNQLLTKAQVHQFFNQQMKTQLAGIAAGQAPTAGAIMPGVPAAAGVVAQPTAATAQAGVTYVQVQTGAQAGAAFQAKLKEVNARPTTLEKISGAQELLILAGQTPAQAEKNSILALANQLFSSPATMTKQELTAARDLFTKLLKHPFILAANQQPAVDSWVKLIDQAMPFMDDKPPLLVSLKYRLGQQQVPYDTAVQAALFALKLLATKLPPAELDKKNTGGLVYMLRDRIVVFYNGRANRSLQELKNLHELLAQSIKRANLSDVLNKRWLDGLNVSIALMDADGKTTTLDKITGYELVSKQLLSTTDRYDKSRFLDGLNSLFINRKDFAQKEIEELRNLFTKLLSVDFKRKGVFDSSQTARLTEMFTILDATCALLQARTTTDLGQKLTLIKKVLPVVDIKKTDYEQRLLILNVNDLFSMRGDLRRDALMLLLPFFTTLQQQAKQRVNLLTPEQLAALDAWIKNLQDAQTIATPEKTYLQGTIDQAVQTRNITLAQNALALFTSTTDLSVKASFAVLLESLFAARGTLDPTALMTLLQAVDKNKLAVLPPEKRDMPSAWIKQLNDDLAAAAKKGR